MREQLTRVLAFAILEELGSSHRLTTPNVNRYVLPKLHKYCIKRETKITHKDVTIALQMIYQVLSQKPISFRFGSGEAYTEERRNTFLSHDFSVE
jgi:hypothetical protein